MQPYVDTKLELGQGPLNPLAPLTQGYDVFMMPALASRAYIVGIYCVGQSGPAAVVACAQLAASLSTEIWRHPSNGPSTLARHNLHFYRQRAACDNGLESFQRMYVYVCVF